MSSVRKLLGHWEQLCVVTSDLAATPPSGDPGLGGGLVAAAVVVVVVVVVIVVDSGVCGGDGVRDIGIGEFGNAAEVVVVGTWEGGELGHDETGEGMGSGDSG